MYHPYLLSDFLVHYTNIRKTSIQRYRLLNSYIEKYNILAEIQIGFRKGHSIEQARFTKEKSLIKINKRKKNTTEKGNQSRRNPPNWNSVLLQCKNQAFSGRLRIAKCGMNKTYTLSCYALVPSPFRRLQIFKMLLNVSLRSSVYILFLSFKLQKTFRMEFFQTYLPNDGL